MASQTPERITPRSEDYSRWYHDVIRQAGLAEPAEVVKGCMVIKPHGYAIWEKIQAGLDGMFKATGHQNAYFPLLIPQSFLQREAEHVEGFAPELAVVTHAGGKLLEEPYVIRPTSETIVGHFFSRWIESYRDLPLLINQWANVVRWELRTRMFLRTTEFLWQEGHTAHATHAEAREEVERMLGVYATFCEEFMAMPVVRGTKTASEKFAGALQSLCIEAMMQDGRALQAGTSHDLGQNFGRAFDVKFQNKAGESEYVWQTSWGASTRLVGGLIMTHSDDRGLVLPPRLAPVQVVIVPIFGKGHDEAQVTEAGTRLQRALQDAGVATVFDVRDYKPGYKYFEWEQKGVPIRLELGPRDLAKNQVMMKDRLSDAKLCWDQAAVVPQVLAHLQSMQTQLYDAALARRQANTVEVETFAQFQEVLANNTNKFVMAHWDTTAQTETLVKETTKATIRCVPHTDSPEPGQCMVTGKPSPQRVVFARAY
jgi:prolyl-tRNA synthetase